MTSHVAFSAADRGRRRRPLVARSSSPSIVRIASWESKLTIRGSYYVPGGSYSAPTNSLQRGEAGLSHTLKGMVDEDEVLEALSNVIDPELGLDFVELGLIYGLEIDGGQVTITYTLTTPACPIGPQVSEQMQEFVGEIEGVEEVVPNMVFTPPWSPDKMSEDAKFALGY